MINLGEFGAGNVPRAKGVSGRRYVTCGVTGVSNPGEGVSNTDDAVSNTCHTRTCTSADEPARVWRWARPPRQGGVRSALWWPSTNNGFGHTVRVDGIILKLTGCFCGAKPSTLGQKRAETHQISSRKYL